MKATQLHGLGPSFRFNFLRFLCIQGRTRSAHIDPWEYTHLLKRCRSLRSLQIIHAQILVGGLGQNLFLAAKLVDEYAGHGGSSLVAARYVFEGIRERDVLLWNVVIRSYASAGPFAEAIRAYKRMRSEGICPNRYTFPFVLKACAAAGDGRKGHQIHAQILGGGLRLDVFVCNALVALYAKCGDIKTARRVFDEMPEKDLVSWNSLMAGYSQNELWCEALMLFHRMIRGDACGNKPDYVTLVTVLPILAHLTAIREGMWAHAYITKSGMEMDVALGSGLVGMYARCGYLRTANKLFESMPERNVVLWNMMIDGYGTHGYAGEALELFWKMVGVGVEPDRFSFVSVISACSHAGKVEEGMELFRRMDEFGVERNTTHYACMVDLLGRAGRLNEAADLIDNMPMEVGKDVWGALLGACRIHNDLQLAELAAGRLLELDPENAGRYILLAKMYEEAGRVEEAARVRRMMRERGVRKPMGCSMVEVDHVVHTFGMEDQSHPLVGRIYETVEQLELIVEEELPEDIKFVRLLV